MLTTVASRGIHSNCLKSSQSVYPLRRAITTRYPWPLWIVSLLISDRPRLIIVPLRALRLWSLSITAVGRRRTRRRAACWGGIALCHLLNWQRRSRSRLMDLLRVTWNQRTRMRLSNNSTMRTRKSVKICATSQSISRPSLISKNSTSSEPIKQPLTIMPHPWFLVSPSTTPAISSNHSS